jgi:hypothetical protein
MEATSEGAPNRHDRSLIFVGPRSHHAERPAELRDEANVEFACLSQRHDYFTFGRRCAEYGKHEFGSGYCGSGLERFSSQKASASQPKSASEPSCCR